MPEQGTFRRAAIFGTGLIGGSFALALRKYAPEIRVAGWDREAVVQEACAMGAVQDVYFRDVPHALAGADLIYLALPIGVTLDVLPELLRHAPPNALITDACSTKLRIAERAAELLTQGPQAGAVFLPGHPMAGKETSGISNATADLFQRAAYALVGESSAAQQDARVRAFVTLVEKIGARPVWIGARQHDYAVALVSHLPQLVATGLASFLYDRLDENGLPVTLAGPGLRDTLRLAGSSYSTWRDVLLTNREFLAPVLELFSRHLDELREKLASRDLEAGFDAANELYNLLRNLR